MSQRQAKSKTTVLKVDAMFVKVNLVSSSNLRKVSARDLLCITVPIDNAYHIVHSVNVLTPVTFF